MTSTSTNPRGIGVVAWRQLTSKRCAFAGLRTGAQRLWSACGLPQLSRGPARRPAIAGAGPGEGKRSQATDTPKRRSRSITH